jgi:hypothetical protein
MPLDDAIKFIYKDFINKTKRIQQHTYQHPDAVQTLLKSLSDNRSLTVLQYDHIIKYLSQRREVQRKAEIGEDASEADFSLMETSPSYQQVKASTTATIAASLPPANSGNDLQKKILEILNKKPILQQISKKIETKSKPMTESEKSDLKQKLMNDDKIKKAMTALRNSKKP